MGQGDNNRAAVEALLSASVVAVSATEARTVANVLARIRAIATSTLSSLPFDLPIERFYGVLESDASREDER